MLRILVIALALISQNPVGAARYQKAASAATAGGVLGLVGAVFTGGWYLVPLGIGLGFGMRQLRRHASPG